MIFPNERDASSPAVFLDISQRRHGCGERAGFARVGLRPHYSTNGYLYVFTTASAGGRHA